MHWTLQSLCLMVPWAALGGLWRPPSLVLAASWMTGQAWWLASGDQVPVALYLATDAAVIASVLRWHGSALDWLMLAAFPFEWVAYLNEQGAPQWWHLWWLVCWQLLLAGPWPQIQRSLHTFTHGPRRAGSLQL